MSKHVGSTLESLFDDADEREEFELLTMKKIISERVRQAMQRSNYNQAQLARAMNSERVQVQRLLDPENTSCTLATLASAFTVLGLKLEVTQKGHVARKLKRVVPKAIVHSRPVAAKITRRLARVHSDKRSSATVGRSPHATRSSR
jgi:antitoxin HicB